MNYLLSGLLILISTGCSINPKQPGLHDFGLPVSAIANTSIIKPVIVVEAPKWLRDTHIHYRLLYDSPTQVRYYTLDRWIAPPAELFQQQLVSSGKLSNSLLTIRLLDFEQRFDKPDRSRVVLRFSVEAATGNTAAQVIYLEQTTVTPNAAGAVKGFADITRQAADRIRDWLIKIPR